MDYLKQGQDILSNQRHGGGGLGGPTSWGCLYKDGSSDIRKNVPCIAQVNSSYNKFRVNNKAAFFIWHQATDTEKNQAYLRYIVSDESPWRDIIRRQPKQGDDFVFRNGFVLTDMNIPANFFVNFLVAFRLSYEKPHCIDFWWDLVKAGVRLGSALMMTSTCQSYKNNKLIFVPDTGHNAFSIPNADLGVCDRVDGGRPAKGHMSRWNFNEDHSYLPCNTIWSNAPLYGDGPFMKNLYAFRDDYGKNPRNNQRFFNSRERKQEMTLEVVRDYLLSLQSQPERKSA